MSRSLFEQYKASLRRGHLAALAGELEDALEAYRTASRLVPERVLPLSSQGTVLHQLDRWPEAAEAFDRALRLAPDDEATLRARGSAREQRGMRSGAAADFERLAFVLDVAGRAAEAAEVARQAANLEPSPSRAALASRLAAAASHRASPAAAQATSPAPAADRGAADLAAIEAEAVAEAPAVPSPAPATVPPPKRAAAPGDAPTAPAAPGARAGTSSETPMPMAVETPIEADPEGPAETMPGAGSQPGPEGSLWPAVVLPSAPPGLILGPPPDPEALMADAAARIDAGDPAAARDLMLTAATVHRAAGRVDAALEACLQLLSIAPGDPQVHLAIANLQLDRAWTGLATEKIELLLRLTSLTGDTQAEADVQGLASERLRDAPVEATAGR